MGSAGLGRRTRLAMPTLLIGANLPDVDVLSYFWGKDAALQFRRGWTHGVLALVVLPLVLTGLMMLWYRLAPRGDGASPDSPFRAREILWLSAVAILTHPFLDWMNVYGMRWLMPFRDTWFYGDTLFIVDPWIWLALAVGLVLGRLGTRSTRPARIALTLVAGYILVMAALARVARRQAEAAFHTAEPLPRRLMVAPVPGDPFRRDILAVRDSVYRLGSLRIWPRAVADTAVAAAIPIRAADLVAQAAARDPRGAAFLRWSRFPYFRWLVRDSTATVRIIDARFQQEWASVEVETTVSGERGVRSPWRLTLEGPY